jgi:hypothetical protein
MVGVGFAVPGFLCTQDSSMSDIPINTFNSCSLVLINDALYILNLGHRDEPLVSPDSTEVIACTSEPFDFSSALRSLNYSCLMTPTDFIGIVLAVA